MAQTGFTPIQLYSTSTAAAAPAAGNLTNSTLGSELAINITDGKLFYKDNANAVQVIGWKIVPTSAGGTGLTSFTANQVFYASSTSAIGQSANLTFNGTTLTANTIGAFTLAGTIAGGGNQINNVIIGTSTPLAGSFTTLSASGVATFSAGTVSLPAITTTGDTNTGIFFPAADTIAFAEGGVEALRINSSGDVGVNTTTANNKLQSAYTVPASAPSAGAGAHGFAVGSSGFGLAAGALTSGKSYLQGTRWDGVATNYNLVLQPNGNDVEIGNGNLVISTSGKGIDFSATPGTGTSELFADYEEGTFTPVVTAGSGSITSYNASGTYVKIGKTVVFQMTFNITNPGTASGFVNFSGLPFTSQNVTNYVYEGRTRENNVSGASFDFLIVANNTTGVILTSTWASNQSYSLAGTYITA
jgi:hypothetical protein